LADYVLPGNDEEAEAISFFASLVAEAIIKAQEKTNTVTEEKKFAS
jgi:ribosomal protein S2